MNQRTRLASALLACALVFSLTAWSQQTQSSASTQKASSSVQGGNSAYRNSPEHYYQLKFRVLDISPEGKVTNSRSYSETIASGPKSDHTSSIRTEDKVKVITGHYSSGKPNSPEQEEYRYIDIGTKIDATRAEMIGQSLSLRVTANIASIYTPATGAAGQPLTRTTSWDSYVIVPVNKPTIIFSADNSADKGKTELELTAVPIGE